MDMKKILSAIDGVKDTSVGGPDMKRFIELVEGKKPSTNRMSVAEQMVMDQFAPKAVPAIEKSNGPSIISKYFDTIKEELELAEDKKYEPARKLASKVSAKVLGEAAPVGFTSDPEPDSEIDTVTVDVPLLIRLLEYAREDAKTDMDLHNVADMLIKLSKQDEILTMDHYDAIVGDQKALPAPDEVTEGVDYVNGKPASKYEDEYSAKQDISRMKKSHPTAKIILKKEVCDQEIVSELSTELLTRYKKAAGADATAADKAGDFKKGDKRFSGIIKATHKQFANDAKKHK